MKFSDIQDLTVDELKKRMAQARIDLFEVKMKHSLGQANNPLEIRTMRRDVAKMKTALCMKLAR